MSAHRPETNAPWVVDRRVLMGTFAAASAVTLLPLPAAAMLQPIDWHIDDQWGVYPRYSDTITYSCPASDDAVADSCA